MKLYGKVFTSEIDMQHVKKDFYNVHYFWELKKTYPSTLNTEVSVFLFELG